MVDPAGVIHSVAGNGTFGATDADGPATDAALGAPYSVAIAPDGTLLIGEVGNQRVLRLDRTSGVLHHVAGRTGSFISIFRGDGGPALAARFSGIEGIGEDRDGKIFIADFRNTRIRMVDRDGSVITVAGTGYTNDSGNLFSGPGAAAEVGCPAGLAVGSDGRVYFTDLRSDRLRVLTLVDF